MSRQQARPFWDSGGEGNRTPDLLNAIQALSQLSYAPPPQSRKEPLNLAVGMCGVNSKGLAKIFSADILRCSDGAAARIRGT